MSFLANKSSGLKEAKGHSVCFETSSYIPFRNPDPPKDSLEPLQGKSCRDRGYCKAQKERWEKGVLSGGCGE